MGSNPVNPGMHGAEVIKYYYLVYMGGILLLCGKKGAIAIKGAL